MKTVRKPRKRKIRYSYKLTKQIVKMIEAKMTLTKICEIEGMPDRSSVHRWRHEHPEFNEQLNIAEDIRLSAFVDEMIDLADYRAYDVLYKKLECEPSKAHVVSEMHRIRLKVDIIKFLAAKLYSHKTPAVDLTKIESVIKVVSYASEKTEEQKVKMIIPDRQPEHLKHAVFTPTQQLQIEELTKK